ncbi:TPA: nickel pincer cofactor biosynthesis protein LarB [Candidatus Poribacteria bacterium]|jgi:NCAIR mutase (PurE)-related protein|nr:nickel pincer cofactor biosynthesis protein LarB [Candidatus Poribacteria bacterium]
MEEQQLRQILDYINKGEISLEEILLAINEAPYETLENYAKLDLLRPIRNGFPEVIYGEGKSNEQITNIFIHLIKHSSQVMATRVSAEMASYVQDRIPDLVYNPLARILYFDAEKNRERNKGIVVITAGTSDIPVAEEAALTAEIMGNQVERIYDVGVAGLHRLLSFLPKLRIANVVIVIAGMEGALASVVGGLVSCPIIAVPTSVGYGANFNGLSALLSMLTSCAMGVAVVNIDNGFGAGVVASRINQIAKNKQ